MSKHADYPPSGLASYELCARYESKTDDEVHPVAAEGSLLHDHVERGTTDGLTAPQARLVEDCMEFCRSQTQGATNEYKEVRVDIGRQDDGTHLTFGTVDHVAIGGDTAVVIDYKFGFNGVDAADTNAQGQAYVLGVLEKWPEVKTVVLHFYLPRRGEHTTHTYTREDESRLKVRIETVLARAKDESLPPTPSPTACMYCGAKAACPALAENALVPGMPHRSAQTWMPPRWWRSTAHR